MFKQRDAIIRLLKDDDPETILLIKQQLVRGGAETIPDLRDLLSIDDERVTVHIREILTEIEIEHAGAAFEEVCRRISSQPELEQACWYLAQIFLPGVEIDLYKKTVDTWADELAGLLDHLAVPSAVVVGHSLGSMVAQRFAGKYPERTKALVLAGGEAELGPEEKKD